MGRQLRELMAWGMALAAVGSVARAEAKPAHDEQISVLAIKGSACRLRAGDIRLGPADAHTRVLPSETIATAPGAPMEGAMWRFGRVRAAGAAAAQTEDGGWSLALDTRLRHAATAGNALFLLYDAADPEAMANKEVAAVYQAPIAAGRTLRAILRLSPTEGICPGHTFHLRIVQLVAGVEVVLAETDVTLV